MSLLKICNETGSTFNAALDVCGGTPHLAEILPRMLFLGLGPSPSKLWHENDERLVCLFGFKMSEASIYGSNYIIGSISLH